MYIYTYIYMYIHIYIFPAKAWSFAIEIHHKCKKILSIATVLCYTLYIIHIYKQTHIYTYIYIYIYYICTYMCMYLCIMYT